MSCVIGTYNRIDGATLSGGSWHTNLPVNNLKTRILGQVARTTDVSASAPCINIDLGDVRSIQIISLVNHNISLNGLVRFVASGEEITGMEGSYEYDSGDIEVWPTVYGSGTLDWEQESYWDGKYALEDASGYNTNICHLIDVPKFYRYWRIIITDPTNSSGYIQLGRVFIGSAWKPENDAEAGLTLGWETNTQVQQSLGGTKYYQKRKPYRVTKFTLNVMSSDEAMTKAFELDRQTGIDGEVMWIQSDVDTIHALRRRFLGTLREMSPIEFPYSNIGKKAYVIEEII